MTHESLMSGVGVECVVFAGRLLEGNAVDVCVQKHSTIMTTRLCFLTCFSLFASPVFQGHWFWFQTHNEVRSSSVKYYKNFYTIYPT